MNISTFQHRSPTSIANLVQLLWCCCPPVQVCAPHSPCGRSGHPQLSRSPDSGPPLGPSSCTAGREFPAFQKGACGPCGGQRPNQARGLNICNMITNIKEMLLKRQSPFWTHLFFSKALKFFLNKGLIWFRRSTKSWLRTLGFAGFGLKLKLVDLEKHHSTHTNNKIEIQTTFCFF